LGERVKYQNLLAFEKHLDQAAKVQLSRVFLIVSSCPYERKKVVDKIIMAIRVKEGEIHQQKEDATQGKVEERIDALNTASLLAGKEILFLDNIDKLKKNALASLAGYVERPSPFAYLLLGASTSKGLNDLYTKGKKELVSCDLSEEKPWDRKDRLKRWLLDWAAKAGKKLHADAAEYLLEVIGLNLPSLEQEMEKLLTYAYERKELSLHDIYAVCAVQKSFTLWQLAEAIVWREDLPKENDSFDLSDLLPLIAQLRTQLQQGLALSILLEKKIPPKEITHYFPQIKPAALDKMIPVCKRRPSAFFKRSLTALFEAELMAKNSSLEPTWILDSFQSKVALLKDHYALPASQSSR
jgi:DNA polymerase III delta subunit